MRVTVRSAVVGEGVALEYVAQGDPAGIPVIFLHGVTDSWRSFEPVLPRLPSAFRVFAVTQRGHGDSTHPTGGYRYANFSEDLHGFMDALHLPAAVIVGHSMGSAVAQRFAIDHPDRTLGLVLMAAFLTIHGHTGVEEYWQSTLSTLTDPIDRTVAEDFQLSTLASPIAPALLDSFVAESLKVPARVWRATFAEFLSTDFSGELVKIQAPTLMMWGEQDTYCGASHRSGLQWALPHARTLVYDDVGHALHWEAPERVARDLVSFVQERCLQHVG